MMKLKKHVFLSVWIALSGLIVITCTKDKGRDPNGSDDDVLPQNLKTQKIWNDVSYHTTANMVRFNDAFYCVFREPAAESAPSGGRVRLISSADGVTWQTVKVFEFMDIPGGATEAADYLTFNGIDQYMKIRHHPDFDFMRDEVFSLSAWVYRDVGSPVGDLVSTRHANNIRAYNLTAQNNTIILDFGTPHWRRHNLNNTSQFVLGEWHHVGFAYDGPNNKIWMYMNGTNIQLQVSETRGTNDLRPTEGNVAEWNDYGNDITVFAQATNKDVEEQVPHTRYSAGRIRTLRFWDKVMTESDMVADMNAIISASTPDLIAGYDFNSNNLRWEGDDLIVPDVKGNHPGILFNIDFVGVPTADLHVPTLSVSPDNRLIVMMYGEHDVADGTLASRRPFIAYSEDGEVFTDMARSEIHYPTAGEVSNGNFRISGVTWDQSTSNGYGFDTSGPVTLFRTTDGQTFQAHVELSGLSGNPTEVQVRFDNQNKMYALFKIGDGTQNAVLAVSAPPYNHFEYHSLDFELHSPQFLVLENNTLVMGAVGTGTNSQNPDAQTQLRALVTNLTGGVIKEVPVPITEADGYPGGMLIHDGYLWFSYSSAWALSGDSRIYVTKLPLEELSP